MAYTAKDITVLEGLEPVRSRPGMYIGGVGSAGLHHLVWEILDNSIDEAMNGHASNISGDASQGRFVDHDRGRWSRHSGRQASEEQEERARGHLHRAARGREVRPRQLQDVRRSPRRRRQRGQRAVQGAGRDGAARRRRVGAAIQAGEAARAAEEARAGARQRHEGVLPPRSGDLSQDRARRRDHPRAARGGQLPAQGPEDRFEDESEKTQGDVRAQRRAARVPQEDRRRARSQAGARRRVLAREGERPARRPRAAVDRGDRRARSQLRQRHPDRVGRHARKRDARGSRARRCATTSRRTTSSPKA